MSSNEKKPNDLLNLLIVKKPIEEIAQADSLLYQGVENDSYKFYHLVI